MARRDTFDLEILGGILGSTSANTEPSCPRQGRENMTHACQLKDFGSQVFQHRRDIDRSLGTNAHLVLGVLLQETLNATAGELGRLSAIAKTDDHT